MQVTYRLFESLFTYEHFSWKGFLYQPWTEGEGDTGFQGNQKYYSFREINVGGLGSFNFSDYFIFLLFFWKLHFSSSFVTSILLDLLPVFGFLVSLKSFILLSSANQFISLLLFLASHVSYFIANLGIHISDRFSGKQFLNISFQLFHIVHTVFVRDFHYQVWLDGERRILAIFTSIFTIFVSSKLFMIVALFVLRLTWSPWPSLVGLFSQFTFGQFHIFFSAGLNTDS